MAGPLVWNSLPDFVSDIAIFVLKRDVKLQLTNSLPDYLRDPAVSRDTFCKHLKTFLFAVY